jgi:hypothetical protein
MEESSFKSKESIILESLLNYFEKEEHKRIMIPIVTETSNISLRILDWFVTNYSKEHTKNIMKHPYFKDFDIYNSYKSQLKAYNKKLFDPFCRLHNNKNINKFRFYHENSKFIITTTGQLNFFKWAIENKVIKYVEEHYSIIKKDLKEKEILKKSSSASSPTTTESEKEFNKKTSAENYLISFD